MSLNEIIAKTNLAVEWLIQVRYFRKILTFFEFLYDILIFWQWISTQYFRTLACFKIIDFVKIALYEIRSNLCPYCGYVMNEAENIGLAAHACSQVNGTIGAVLIALHFKLIEFSETMTSCFTLDFICQCMFWLRTQFPFIKYCNINVGSAAIICEIALKRADSHCNLQVRAIQLFSIYF